jgi:putative hydrolase of the HAD superfamily
VKFNRVWVFDLDNTLHDATPRVFPHINLAMTVYLQRQLGLDEEAAANLRRHYWQRYGATLIGMMRHHATNPADFLRCTHDVPLLRSMVKREPGLRSALRRLPGRKAVFSNAPVRYSEAVLQVLGIAQFFDNVYSIEHTRYRPKPDSYGFLRLFRKLRVRPEACIMVEDTLANLKTAKKLGMSTIWVANAARIPRYVDFNVRRLLQLPRLSWRLTS